MSDINDKYRSELKSYFIAYAIPTEQNFEDLIDAMIIQGEDPVAVTPESPLMVKVSGDDQTREEFIRFYAEFEQDHYWSLAQNPGDAPEGFEIAATKTTKLFIQKDNAYLGVNTANPKGQLDVRIADFDDDTIPLVIGQDGVNYFSVSSLNDNAKVIIGRQTGNFTGDEAKLHVTLDDDNVGASVHPLMIENAKESNEYLFIKNNGQVGINADEDYLDQDDDTKLNVHGNIKAGNQQVPFYLKNSGSNEDPALVSTIANNWLKIISNSSLGFWANSGEPADRENPDVCIEAHKVGIGITATNAKLAVNGSLYIGNNEGSHNTNNKLDVEGDTKIAGDVLIAGNKTLTINDNLIINESSIDTGSGKLLLAGNTEGVNIYDEDTMEVKDNAVRIGSDGSKVAELHLNGGLFVPDYDSGNTAVDFSKLKSIQKIDFGSNSTLLSSNGGQATGTIKVSFSSDVQKAEAMIKSWRTYYTTSDDHHVKDIYINITNVQRNGSDVDVSISAQLADGNSDDDWAGDVTVVVIAILGLS